MDSSVRIACRAKGECSGAMVGETWAAGCWGTWEQAKGYCSNLGIPWEFKPL